MICMACSPRRHKRVPLTWSRQHLDTAAGAQAEFRHAADPGKLAMNLHHVGCFASLQQFQRQQGDIGKVHETVSADDY
jgi:hypothetical protein